jgi:hypothetical protein
MLNSSEAILKVTEVDSQMVKEMIDKNPWQSIIGHEATSSFVSKIIGTIIPHNRVAVKLEKDDILLVCQLQGRLPEGRILNEEELSQIPYKWYKVEIL